MADACALLREARTRAGLSQAELARRSGTSQAAVARYETGQVSPTASTMEKLLGTCGFTLDLRPHDTERYLIDVVMGHRAEIVKCAAARGVTKVRVVGAAARGELDGGTTTIELVVEMDPDHDTEPVDDLAEELTMQLGRRVVIVANALAAPSGGIPL